MATAEELQALLTEFKARSPSSRSLTEKILVALLEVQIDALKERAERDARTNQR
jgi:hypothetical protein